MSLKPVVGWAMAVVMMGFGASVAHAQAAAPVSTPEAAPAPVAAAAAPAAPKARRHGYLAVLGLTSLVVGAGATMVAGAAVLSPAVVGNSFGLLESNTYGVELKGTGRSINPFYVLGGAAILLGGTLSVTGASLLGLETYLNDGFSSNKG